MFDGVGDLHPKVKWTIPFGLRERALSPRQELIVKHVELDSFLALKIPPSPSSMVKTRRKSKAAAAAAAAAEQDQETASTQGTEDISMSAPTSAPPSSVSFSVPIPDDLDVDALSQILPDVSFVHPNPETIIAVYRILLAQVAENDATQRDLEDARAEVERKEVELDQAFQDSETKTKDLENSLENMQNQLNALKGEREQLGTHTSDIPVQLALKHNFFLPSRVKKRFGVSHIIIELVPVDLIIGTRPVQAPRRGIREGEARLDWRSQ